MAKRDYYEILGVSKSASDDDVKKSYRKLAQQYHPDKGGDQEKFKEINEAYQTLSDQDKRSAYDRFGHAASDASGFSGGQSYGGFGGFDSSQFNVDFENFGGGLGDVFDVFFGGGGRTRQVRPKDGQNLELRIKISFKDSIYGLNQEISFDRIEICPICKGSGAEPGHSVKTCPTCNGSGQFNETRQTFLGVVSQASVCPTCKGKGKIPEKICHKCSSAGLVKARATLKVKIPAGIRSGATIRLSGEGNAGEVGGRTGDLFLVVMVEADKRFERTGDDISSKLVIDFIDAALGTQKEIETVYGTEKIKIHPGTQSGDVVVIKNQGAPDIATNRRGNHLVEVTVNVPKHLTRKQKQLLEEYRDSD